jgi:hypothetical protein
MQQGIKRVGRDDCSASDGPTVHEEAAPAHNEHTADYLLGRPLLGDFLKEGALTPRPVL